MTASPKMPELLPCERCGAKLEISKGGIYDPMYGWKCSECPIQARIRFSTVEEAITHANRRTPPPAPHTSGHEERHRPGWLDEIRKSCDWGLESIAEVEKMREDGEQPFFPGNGVVEVYAPELKELLDNYRPPQPVPTATPELWEAAKRALIVFEGLALYLASGHKTSIFTGSIFNREIIQEIESLRAALSSTPTPPPAPSTPASVGEPVPTATPGGMTGEQKQAIISAEAGLDGEIRGAGRFLRKAFPEVFPPTPEA